MDHDLLDLLVRAARSAEAVLVQVDADVVAATLAGARQWVDDSVRVPGMFGPAVPVDGAAPIDELVAFLGCDPAWSP